MSAQKQADFFEKWRETGWIPEPDTLKILKQAGLQVVDHCRASSVEEAKQFARDRGFPLVAKIISPAIMHKSDVGGVATGVESEEELALYFERFSQMEGFTGMLVAEMVSGLELIVGAKMDRQFGPVILLGIGGTGVEIYRDVVIRMAPLTREDVEAMAAGLEGASLLRGFRQKPPISMDDLSAALLDFSDLVMKHRNEIESADINPLICSTEKCLVADARIVLRSAG